MATMSHFLSLGFRGARVRLVGAGLVAWVAVAAAPSTANARTLRVPRDYPTIQGAVDAASGGDEIEVAKGRYCGATVTKPLTLTSAKKGAATIIGCATSPILTGPLRVGFLLPGSAGSNPASGTKIHGFSFDGKGVSNSNFTPLAFGVYARFADHIIVEDNEFVGTVQAVTNTAGDHWQISDNCIKDLALFDCTGAFCGGGVGIAVQVASAAVGVPGGAGNPVNRPEGNAVIDNDVAGKAPVGFNVFGIDGILAFAADGTVIAKNKTKLVPGVVSSDPLGVGVVITNTCCDDPTEYLPGARFGSVIFHEDDGQFGIVVEGTGGANTLGLVLFGNHARTLIEGNPAAPAEEAVARIASAAALVARPRRVRFE